MKLDIDEIKKHLPHRYPFLLIDRVLDLVPGESVKVLKNVTINEPFFPGHFPGYPLMPGVLILEIMAQAGGLLGVGTDIENTDGNRIFLFAGVDKARFKSPVRPGDQLIVTVRIKRRVRNLWYSTAVATVDDKACCSASLLFTYRDLQ